MQGSKFRGSKFCNIHVYASGDVSDPNFMFFRVQCTCYGTHWGLGVWGVMITFVVIAHILPSTLHCSSVSYGIRHTMLLLICMHENSPHISAFEQIKAVGLSSSLMVQNLKPIPAFLRNLVCATNLATTVDVNQNSNPYWPHGRCVETCQSEQLPGSIGSISIHLLVKRKLNGLLWSSLETSATVAMAKCQSHQRPAPLNRQSFGLSSVRPQSTFVF